MDIKIKQHCISEKSTDQRVYQCVTSKRVYIIFSGAEKGWMYTGIKSLSGKQIVKIKTLSEQTRTFPGFIFSFVRIKYMEYLMNWIVLKGQPINVPASRFVRPYSPS